MQRLPNITSSRAVLRRYRFGASPLSTLPSSLRVVPHHSSSSPSSSPPFSSRNASRFYSATAATTNAAVAAAAAAATSNDTEPSAHFRKVLIANRGEIAIRVARTCRRLGIPTVAVYATNDAHSLHVTECDEAYCLGPSYLDPPAILRALETTGADALHPGYGFLSENAEFAKAVVGADVVWLGPPPMAIVDMGCKLRSKEIAKEAGVAIIPGGDNDGALNSLEDTLELMRTAAGRSDGLRYPVLLKAAAGGGGKGMRICYNEEELTEGYPLAKSEGLKFFADDRLLLEQYLEDPHHIEFQVVCDKRPDGKVDVAIFAERECSVQRRNQKVVEESPSCLLREETRRRMMEQTTLLCQSVGYEGAGTVEWLVTDSDYSNNSERQHFYFLEMNTRLQVEHPITEAVAGDHVDLVAAMLRVGAGEGLPTDCGGKMLVMPWNGHAIEGRIYAEDPLRGYLPSTGPLVPYREPSEASTVSDVKGPSSERGASYLRLDSGVTEGHVVTPFYDPMLSKIISYAPTREEAIEVLSMGLDSYVIEGVNHNARLVQAVLRHPAFRAGNTPTSFLESHIPDFATYSEEELAVAVALVAKAREEHLGRPPAGGTLGSDDNDSVVSLDFAHHLARVTLDGTERTLQVLAETPSGSLRVQMCGALYHSCLVQSPREYELSRHMLPPVIEDTSDKVLSPMPGTLINFADRVFPGAVVEEGQELCVVEAMKMQNVLRATRGGTIASLKVETGAALATDQVILEFEQTGDDESLPA
eukprot:jgi/Psemu1/209152/e_gw1.490.42.1